MVVIIISAGLVLFFSIGTLLTLMHKPRKMMAKIYQNNQLIREIDLNKISEPYEIEILGDNGEKNVVLVEKGDISMKTANCPDLTCVTSGRISKGRFPIVCAPNHVLIVTGENQDEGDDKYDAEVR